MKKSKPIYKKMKVFDCQWNPGMPEDIKKIFFELHSDPAVGNDVFIEWTIQDSIFDPTDQGDIKRKKIDDWLIANGAKAAKSDDDSGETVLIKHWW